MQQDAPEIAVEQVHPTNAGAHYVVAVTVDDEPVEGATVTATPTGPDGSTGAGVTLVDDDGGRYEGAVELPKDGEWTVAFTSTHPAATLEYSQVVPAEPVGEDHNHDASLAHPVFMAGVLAIAVVAALVSSLLDRRRRGRAGAGADAG